MYRRHKLERTLTLSEQVMVEEYLKRKLDRPKTNIYTAVIYILSILFASGFITVVICFVADVLVVSFDPAVHVIYTHNKSWTDIVFFNIKVLIGIFIITLRMSLIGLVHLYQHYAPEQMRRRCLCMPSCSEYMILAIKKYGPFIGVYKGIRRLTKTCDGILYKIDYP